MGNIHYDIIDAIRKYDRITATDLVGIVGKHKSTISPCVQSLISKKLIREAGTSDSQSRGGKPRVYLELNPAAATFLGMELNAAVIRIFALDGCGSAILQETFEYSGKSSESFVDDMDGALQTVLSRPDLQDRNIEGIGVGFSGHVNSRDGIIFESHTFGLKNFPMKQHLEDLYKVPCHVVNDANAAMIAEKVFILDKEQKNIKNALFLYFGSTFMSAGFGIIINDELFEGSNYRAGELYDYHTFSMDPDLLNKYPFRALQSFIPLGPIDANPETVGAVQGMVQSLMENVIEQLIATYRLINPDLAVIGGDIMESHPNFHLPFIAHARERVAGALQKFIDVDVRPSKLATRAVAVGACVPLFDAFYRRRLGA